MLTLFPTDATPVSSLEMYFASKWHWYSALSLVLLNCASNCALSSSTTSEFDEDFERTTWNGVSLVEGGEEATEVISTLKAQENQGNRLFNNQSHVKKKVDELGDILKKKVEMLQMRDNRKLDIVFLIDASSSMGDENFISELKFVKKLLADFTIAVNETRVAVITFSDPDKVIRHIDHITDPSSENHKCNMLHSHLLNINYTGGLTYTLGALLEAQGVLMRSREGAQKAVFLITDGFSNGGDPVPVAQILKDNGTYIFTFGIQSGNIIELQNISSPPAEHFSYFVDSFGQFEAVVRRALHQDLSSGFYQVLTDMAPCNLLCSARNSSGCCDAQARCSCGTGTGHYRCLCNPGYYGSGLKDSCTPCPSGTYHDGLSAGDESVCLPCPDPNHITNVGNASSRASCVCKKGFAARGDFCEIITCPPIYPPENGYFVKGGLCQRVFNAACGVRCKAGYTLHGSSIRLCQENSTWSGKEPKCIVKMCPNPEMPQNGDLKCSLPPSMSNDFLDPAGDDSKSLLYAVDTECQFTCRPGHLLVGSRRRICLPLARWDGLRTVCKPITCRPLPKVFNGLVTPLSCTASSKLPFGQRCNISCEKGYKLVGPISRKCGGKGGQWSLKSSASKCLDEEPPAILCPANIETSSDTGEAFATIVIPSPVTSDNSGQPPFVWSQPTLSLPMKIPIGILQITFIAMDSSHNQAQCNMTITVLDKEPPMIETCISPNHIHLMETGGNRTVSWLEPEFYDNSGKKPRVVSSHSYGEFPVGKTDVKVVAIDESGNNSTCVLEIVVEDSPCRHQPPHATTVCNLDGDISINCSTTCHEGYVFDMNGIEETDFLTMYENGSLYFSCPVSKNEKYKQFIDSFTLPQCRETVLPNSISQEGEMTFIANKGACSDRELLSKVKHLVQLELSRRSEDICNTTETSCNILNTNATCEEIASLEEEETNTIHHRKRSIGSLSSKESYESKFRRRDTTARSSASSINIQFTVNTQFQEPEARQLGNGGLSQLKDSLSRSLITLPPNISKQTMYWKGKEVLTCANGSVPHSSGFCVKCPAGSFFTTPPHKCLPCPLGKYQNLKGQSSCFSCPNGMSTRYDSSQSVLDCNYLCQPGTYGRTFKSGAQNGNSVSPCFPCNTGSFQPNYGATNCLQCPPGLHSFKKGAKSIKECLKMSGKANWSSPSSCLSHLCQNGGSCRSIPLGFISCDCQRGFYGSVCELAIDDCSSGPCLNGGQCSNKKPSGYECQCPPGFHGKNCQDDIDECIPNPCLNNSTCEDLNNGYFCDCLEGFQGLNCDENIDDCFNGPCGDHGLCIDGVANYTCSCTDGYSGRYCETEPADPCFEENPCLNGGSCVPLNTKKYRCICPPGWEGEHCNKELNGCLPSPCLNNGTCVKRKEGKFLCHCPANFAGYICQTSLHSNFILYMHSPSVTDYSMVDFPSQNFTELTTCLWLKSKDGFNYGTAFSYATENQSNTFTLTDYNGFVLYVNGDRVVTDVSANDGLWHHICVLWQSNQGLWSIHLDGVLRDMGSGLSSNHHVRGGGKLVLGQEQDRIGGGFSESESLIGRVYKLDVWDYMLSFTRIITLARECTLSLDGSVVRWTDFLPNIRGKIKVENSTFCSECPTLASLWHGTVKLVKANDVTYASYECDDGFVIHKSKLTSVKRYCLKHGSWEGDPPECVRRSCGFPGYLPGGTFTGRSFLYTDTIKYMCHFGAQILGNTTRVCEANGKWSGEPPICKGSECQPLKAPEHGVIALGKKAGGIQIATFSCDNGFHVDGAHILTCMYDGTWDETMPDCLRNSCPSPPEISHGGFEKNSRKQFLYEEKVYYECEPEYELAPGSPGVMQCNEEGNWCPHWPNPEDQSNATLPVCELKHCLQPENLEHGSWKLKHGLVIANANYSLGSVVAAVCETDYNISGPKNKLCKDKVWWPLEITQCAKVTCDTEGLPYDLPHSILDLTGEEVHDKATLSCKKTYRLSRAKGGSLESNDYIAERVPGGKLSWECKLDGSWSMSGSQESTSSEFELLACLPELQENVTDLNVACDHPKAPEFGYVASDRLEIKNSVGTFVEVRCRPGFWLDGPSTMVCGKNGTWLSTSSCKPIKCQSPPNFPNMVLISTTAVGQDEEFGNMVTFECQSGFQRGGDLSIRCQLTGTWSPMRGKCILPS
ncbi:sushi, von Willebrand factor type A, EGF and pentraxin domain-containing protein 1-like isoform X2 [Thrips palmi]|uniref:Sushi, von Willebrand factor type A, EGF and pentraxin domain-containing protein 1-like isoform X2 n=1 Tax=Thrips palmi TaxID=161013 RepID=A0A6P9AED8_THRPL|nr:sushi, von Willebrand factor type A, EGF and pentraxin domain-containing protein 1-like isoform X2 [Thrips palmi]